MLPAYVEELALGIGFVTTFCIEVVFFVEFLSGDSGNPSRGEGGDVELGGRTSKLVLVYAFSYLSQLYSLYILQYYYYSSIHAWYYAYTYINQKDLLKYFNF